MSGRWDELVIEQGATFAVVVKPFDRNNNPISLVGCTAKMQIRPTPDQVNTAIVTLSTSDSTIQINGAAGTITLTLSPTQTAAFTFASGFYDLEVTSSNGFIQRILQGLIRVNLQVTQTVIPPVIVPVVTP